MTRPSHVSTFCALFCHIVLSSCNPFCFISVPLHSVANVRSHLAAAVPLSDQILLLGPPYKVPKDPIFQSEEILNSLRLGDMEDDPIHEEEPEQPDTTTSAATTATATPSSEALSQQENTSALERQSPPPPPSSSHQPRSLLKLPRRRLLNQSSSFAHRSTTTPSTTTTTSTSQFGPSGTAATGMSSSIGAARRLFLFSKTTLSAPVGPLESYPQCRLSPQSITLPTDVRGPSPLADALAVASQHGSSPLHQALVAYEGQFRMYLEHGRALADAADLRVESCVTCLQEQAITARALEAAVSNLTDHANNAHRAMNDFATLFQSKTTAHATLLQGFEPLLRHLSAIPLHPSLVARASTHRLSSTAAATNTTTAASTSAVPSTSIPRTLLDTVPVERERTWALQCQDSHNKLVAVSHGLETDFAQWSEAQSTGSDGDAQAILHLEQRWEQVQGTGKAWQKQQAERLEQLTASHAKVVKTILKAVRANQESAIQAAFVPLGELSETSIGLVPAMLQTDTELQALQQAVADSKTHAQHRLRVRLREISAAQSGIQKALSSLSVLKDALKLQCDNMEHLEHVAELPSAYQQFLQEIRRRRAFGQAVAASSTALLERVAAMREDEVKAREKFLRGPGRHLMPAFYDVFVPSLASPPPLFAPQLPLNELDALPDVGDDAGGSAEANLAGEYSSMQVAEHGVSSASSLTTSEQQVSSTSVAPDQEMSSGMGGEPASGAPLRPQPPPDPVQQQQQQQQQQDQLIVSASEQSANDLYLDPATGAAAEAEARTLAYENLILRQAVERLGGKAPRTYLQEARASSATAAVAAATTTTTTGSGAALAAAAASAREVRAQAEVAALRKELAEVQARAAQVAAAATLQTQTQRVAATSSSSTTTPTTLDPTAVSDKISHSSFQVGDVGLFMPTGRGSGGKRTYLAFHTKCPYRFLSTDNIKGTPDYVLGRIVYQEELVAGELGTDANPYGLPVGTKFWVLTVEVLTSQS